MNYSLKSASLISPGSSEHQFDRHEKREGNRPEPL